MVDWGHCSHPSLMGLLGPVEYTIIVSLTNTSHTENDYGEEGILAYTHISFCTVCSMCMYMMSHTSISTHMIHYSYNLRYSP